MKAIDLIRRVSASGQISLGKEYAGKHVLISKLENGTLLIKSGEFIPDNEPKLGINLNRVGNKSEIGVPSSN